MRGSIKLLMAVAITCPACIYAGGTNDIATRLRQSGPFTASATFEVLLPSAADPIVYEISLESTPSAADTLSPCDYLIQWTMPQAESDATGFAAYFGGHHYRYRGDRMQEYHTDWDITPFAPGGRAAEGVQRTAQFADLLPAILADKLAAMDCDTTFRYTFTPDTISGGRHVSVLDGVQSIRGFDGLEFTFVFDRDTSLPLRIDLLSNPGSIAEQTLTVNYTYPAIQPEANALSEDRLMQLYPEVFEKYRQSNFRIENLAGSPLPAFSAPTITGERYTHERSQAMRVPTIIAILDPSQGNPSEVVAQLRDAAAGLPFDTDIIWAFVSNKAEVIEETVGFGARQGEHTLMNARALARDAGVSAYPSIVLTDASGNVTDVIIGFNNNLASDVIQKMALAN